jgi:hypothetical protein
MRSAVCKRAARADDNVTGSRIPVVGTGRGTSDDGGLRWQRRDDAVQEMLDPSARRGVVRREHEQPHARVG